jgi:hypothetical protein
MSILTLDLKSPQIPEPSRPPAVRLPRVWVGYLFAAGFFLVTLIDVILDPTAGGRVTVVSFLAWLPGFVYWLFCVYRLHRVLNDATSGTYPIRPTLSVLGHLLPLYNLVFIFTWSNALVDFVNRRAQRRQMWKVWPGLALLAGFLISKLIDSAIGEVVLFSVLLYMTRRVQQVLSIRTEATST